MFFKNRRYQKQTDHLLAVAKIAAVSNLVPLLDRLPALKQVMSTKRADTWDFFATVAGVGAGMLSGYRSIPEADVPVTEEALRNTLTNWDKQATTRISTSPAMSLAM